MKTTLLKRNGTNKQSITTFIHQILPEGGKVVSLQAILTVIDVIWEGGE